MQKLSGHSAVGLVGYCLILCALLVCNPLSSSSPRAVEGFMSGPATTNESLVGQNMTVSFPQVPNLLFLFKTLTGEILPGVNQTYWWVSLDEIDNSTGTAVEGGSPVVVQSLNLQDPNLVWSETVQYPVDQSGNQYKNINYTTTFANGVQVTFAYYHFPSPFLVDYPYINLTRLIPADSFKVSIAIKNWKPISSSNLFLLRLEDRASPYFARVVYSQAGFTYTVQIDVGDNQVTQWLNLLSAAVLDDIPRQMNWYAEYVGLTLVPEIQIQGFKLYFYFPNFNDTLFYDPDLSVLVLDQGSGGNSYDSGGSDDTTTIVIAVLVPTLVVGALLVLVAVVLVTMVFFRKKLWGLRNRLSRMSDIGDAAEKAEVPD